MGGAGGAGTRQPGRRAEDFWGCSSPKETPQGDEGIRRAHCRDFPRAFFQKHQGPPFTLPHTQDCQGSFLANWHLCTACPSLRGGFMEVRGAEEGLGKKFESVFSESHDGGFHWGKGGGVPTGHWGSYYYRNQIF